MSLLGWKTLVRMCHCCGQINEGEREVLRCENEKCQKTFLPLTTLSELFSRTGVTKKDLGLEESAELPFYAPLHGLVVFW